MSDGPAADHDPPPLSPDSPAPEQDPRYARFVLAGTVLSPVPVLPELRLHLAQDAFALWEQTEREAGRPDQPPPFWAFAWPGGLALARYLLDHPHAVAGRRVLDLGSGSGLTAIAAAMAGAASTVASEVDPFAIAAIGLNAAANHVSVAVAGDVLGTDGGGAEVVLAGDVWYERDLAQRALGLLRRAADRGALRARRRRGQEVPAPRADARAGPL